MFQRVKWALNHWLCNYEPSAQMVKRCKISCELLIQINSWDSRLSGNSEKQIGGYKYPLCKCDTHTQKQLIGFCTKTLQLTKKEGHNQCQLEGEFEQPVFQSSHVCSMRWNLFLHTSAPPRPYTFLHLWRIDCFSEENDSHTNVQT